LVSSEAGAAADSEGAGIALRIRGAVKHFGGTKALDDVSLDVSDGKVHALLGANGSGKSTLIKALVGFHNLDAGSVAVHGRMLSPDRLGEHGKEAGLRFVHQDLALVPTLSIADNLAFGRGYSQGRTGSITWRSERQRARRELGGVGLFVDPNVNVSDLGPVERALVAIARALDHIDPGRNVLVLDEPTARLPQEEAARLIARLGGLKRRGLPVLYVTHRLEELPGFADEVTVLRDGRVVYSGTFDQSSTRKLRLLIAGIEDIAERPVGASGQAREQTGTAALELRQVSSRRFRAVDLQVRRGEVTGVTGLVGSGRSELGRVIYGLQKYTGGEIQISGRKASFPRSDAQVWKTVGYVPQNRLDGLLMGLPIQDNVTISSFKNLANWFGLSRRRVAEATMEVIRTLRIRPERPKAVVNLLSGGNQQKVALGKWVRLPLQLLILDEPTQSIDVGAKIDLMKTIRQQAQQTGLAVLCLESDIEELVKYADRILVMTDGQITAEFADRPFVVGEVIAQAYTRTSDRNVGTADRS
jgi:ribose transport system ATP-binding protein